MSDLISRRDAMMEARPDYLNPNQKGHEEYNKAWNDAIKAYWNGLKELPSELEWIPCSERLPEEREWIGTEKFGTTISNKVLVTFESRGERFVKPMHFQNGELGGMDKHTMDAIHGEWKAVAWMPLPEPYREDGEA